MFKFFNYLYKDYKRKTILEEQKYIFDKNTQFILFSGTSLGEDGDMRHLNDLYFVLYILKYYNIDPNSILLSIDVDILEELDRMPCYKLITELIKNSVGNIIDIQNFEKDYKRPSDKNIVFVASGHGDINGLSISKNKTSITSDFFEKIALEQKSTLIIMSQCFAGAFHHLDTRKNICVMGASEYQKSLSIPIRKLVCHYKITEELSNFLLYGLAFNPGISINPFLFAFVITTIEPNIFIKSDKKHLINIYKSTAALTLEYMENTYHLLTLKEVRTSDNEYIFDGIRITQQPYLLNKILAARYSIS
ncbi:hypothetical protein ACOTWJ_09295 [Aliarcobacter butzleri]